MKILHAIETSGPGGAENFMIRTAQALGPEYKSSVLMIKPGWLYDRLLELGFTVHMEKLRRALDPFWLKSVTRYVRENGFEAIHSHEFAMNIHLGIVAWWLGIPHVATVHGKKQYADRGIRRLAYRLISRNSKIVAVSEDVKSFLVDTVGIKAHRVQVIVNGIDVSDYSIDEKTRAAVRASLGCQSDTYLICAIGNLYPIKGHKYLVEAMAQLVRDHPNIKLVIAGRGGEEVALRDQIAALELGNYVELLGFRGDVKEILLSSDLFVMPSLSEGLPLSLLEAMAARVPVVVSAVGGMPEVIEYGVNGLAVPPADVNALRSAIASLLDNPECGNRLCAQAYTCVQAKYSIVRMLDGYRALYV